MAVENKIMRLPRALLSLLDTKSLGKNPPTYGDELALTFETYEHYLPAPTAFTATTAGIVVAANAGIVTVPATDLWVVRVVSGRMTATVGGGVQAGTLMVQPSGTGISMALYPQLRTAALVVGESARQGGWVPGGFFLAGPGTLFLNRIDLVAGTIDAQTLILAHRLRI